MFIPNYPPTRENDATDHILVVSLRLGISKGGKEEKGEVTFNQIWSGRSHLKQENKSNPIIHGGKKVWEEGS